MPYSFNLPLITDLTTAQQAVLNETKPIAIAGGPGTGKSVVMLWRHIRNYSSSNVRSLLLTYTKSLEYYLKHSASKENETAGRAVDRTYAWTTYRLNSSYDEIIIDEAQDVEEAHYFTIKKCTKNVSYSADNQQSLYPDRETTQEQFKTLFPNNESYELDQNFRNTYEITYIIKSLFPDRIIPDGDKVKDMPKPTIILTNDNNNFQEQAIKDILDNFQSDTHNIAILLPLENPVSHISGMQTVNDWYELLKNNYVCSKYTNGQNNIGTIENVHITTFKSAKGLEFDTVIIPNFHLFHTNIQNLNKINHNDYYVALTRAKRNLYLIDNSSTNGNSVVFLQQAITHNLVEINNDYIQNNPTKEPDDLPF
jgi:superfamily I DNA/RNA helicase